GRHRHHPILVAGGRRKRGKCTFAPSPYYARRARPATGIFAINNPDDHLGETRRDTIINPADMKVTRDEDHILNAVLLDEVSQSAPFGLITGPAINKFCRWISRYGSKDDLPGCPRSE